MSRTICVDSTAGGPKYKLGSSEKFARQLLDRAPLIPSLYRYRFKGDQLTFYSPIPWRIICRLAGATPSSQRIPLFRAQRSSG